MILARINLKSIISTIKSTALAVFVLSICVTLMVVPSSSSRGVSNGISYCLNILIPSLFPFMFMASFIVRSGFFRNFRKIFSPVTKSLFYLPGCTAPAIFLSLIGGYPVGARSVKSLLQNEEINTEQANRMMCFCVNAGPAFIMGVVGNVLLKNSFIGILMFTVQIIVSLSIGVLCGIKARVDKKEFYSKKESAEHIRLKISSAMISSCEEASKSIFGMCALVIIFSALISMIQDFNILNSMSGILLGIGVPKSESLALMTSMLEITSGCAEAARLHALPVTISFALGYGGVCVHLQVASILNQAEFNYREFCIFRFFGALMSGALTYTGTHIFEEFTDAFSASSQPIPVPAFSTAHGSIALIAFCLYFICTINIKPVFKKRNTKKLIKPTRH